jgi:hypothetical protein
MSHISALSNFIKSHARGQLLALESIDIIPEDAPICRAVLLEGWRIESARFYAITRKVVASSSPPVLTAEALAGLINRINGVSKELGIKAIVLGEIAFHLDSELERGCRLRNILGLSRGHIPEDVYALTFKVKPIGTLSSNSIAQWIGALSSHGIGLFETRMASSWLGTPDVSALNGAKITGKYKAIIDGDRSRLSIANQLYQCLDCPSKSSIGSNLRNYFTESWPLFSRDDVKVHGLTRIYYTSYGSGASAGPDISMLKFRSVPLTLQWSALESRLTETLLLAVNGVDSQAWLVSILWLASDRSIHGNCNDIPGPVAIDNLVVKKMVEWTAPASGSITRSCRVALVSMERDYQRKIRCRLVAEERYYKPAGAVTFIPSSHGIIPSPTANAPPSQATCFGEVKYVIPSVVYSVKSAPICEMAMMPTDKQAGATGLVAWRGAIPKTELVSLCKPRDAIKVEDLAEGTLLRIFEIYSITYYKTPRHMVLASTTEEEPTRCKENIYMSNASLSLLLTDIQKVPVTAAVGIRRWNKETGTMMKAFTLL